MTEELTDNTKAALLLIGPLISGRDTRAQDLLTPGEFKRLERRLEELSREPADLISSDAASLIQECGDAVSSDRLEHLLGRSFLLGPVVESWQTRSIWVTNRSDSHYPGALSSTLGEDAPALLYGCGDRSLLGTGGLAVVGSRNADPDAMAFAEQVGSQAASSGITIVSGGARGIDQTAMLGAANSGGNVVGVLADGLQGAVVNRDNREVLMQGTLCLVSPYDPNAGFNVGNAMQRNKVIYALAQAGLVISTDLGKGGTWSGAKEQLDRFHFGPIFVRDVPGGSPGLDGLRAKGAQLWPNPSDQSEFRQLLEYRRPVEISSQDSSLTLF
jgi:predicted Rossmann fold nucleotide-binding protein DprA/Smf involved in DNA uptake